MPGSRSPRIHAASAEIFEEVDATGAPPSRGGSREGFRLMRPAPASGPFHQDEARPELRASRRAGRAARNALRASRGSVRRVEPERSCASRSRERRRHVLAERPREPCGPREDEAHLRARADRMLRLEPVEQRLQAGASARRRGRDAAAPAARHASRSTSRSRNGTRSSTGVRGREHVGVVQELAPEVEADLERRYRAERRLRTAPREALPRVGRRPAAARRRARRRRRALQEVRRAQIADVARARDLRPLRDVAPTPSGAQEPRERRQATRVGGERTAPSGTSCSRRRARRRRAPTRAP